MSRLCWRLRSRLSTSRHCHWSPLGRGSSHFRSWRAVSFECPFQRSGPGKQSLLNACPGAQASNAQASSGAPSLQGTSPTGARREPHGGVADCRVHRRPPSEQRNVVPIGKRGKVSFIISARARWQYVWRSVVESIVCSVVVRKTEERNRSQQTSLTTRDIQTDKLGRVGRLVGLGSLG